MNNSNMFKFIVLGRTMQNGLFPVFLRNNWPTSLGKFKAYSMKFDLHILCNDYHNRFS